MSNKSRIAVAAGALALTGALLLAGCSGNPDGQVESGSGNQANSADVNYLTAQGSPNEKLRDLLPSEIRDAGTLVIATDATIGEPFASYADDNVTVKGLAPDIAQLISDRLGVDIELRHATFANLIPGLKAERYAFSIAPMLDTEEREKEVDFVGYIRGGSAFIIASDSGQPDDLTLEDLCGLKVGFAQGSVEEISVGEQNDTCVSDGKKAIELLGYQTNNEGVLALTSGRADVYATAAAQAGYIAITDQKRLATSGAPFSSGLSGMAFPKESQMLDVIGAVMSDLVESGDYEKALAVYGIDYLAVDGLYINNKAVD